MMGRMTRNHLVRYFIVGCFISLYSVVSVSAGCESVCYGDGWCSQTCDGGSYPTNDGCHQGTEECGGAGNVGVWVNEKGIGQADKSPTKYTATKPSTPVDVNGVGVSSPLTNCATGVPCSPQQAADAYNAFRYPSMGWRPPSSNDMTRLVGGSGYTTSLDPDIKDLIAAGKIVVTYKPGSGGGPGSYIIIPNYFFVPPAVQQAQGAQGNPAPAGFTYEPCRICENGNYKTEEVPSSTCNGKELNYCADYHLASEVDPIVEYRFPICHTYAINDENTRTFKIATRAHPILSTHQFSLADDANPNEKCTLEMVGPDGTPNPTVISGSDLQVVRCDIAKKPIGVKQDIIISSSSLPADGYGSPAWADRNLADLTTCMNLRTTADSKPTNKVSIETFGQQLLAIALPFSSPWIKVADGTYARSAITGTSSLPLTNYLPGFTAPFNSADVDTEASIPHFLTGSGAGTVAGTVQVGSVATVSATNWKADAYTTTSSNSPTTLYKQLIQKKVYKEYPAASPPPAALVLSDEITIINDATEAGYTLSSLAFSPTDAKTSYTLIIKNGSSLGNLTIDTASLNPSGSPALLIIANNIILTPQVSTIGAIIVANTLDTGTGSSLHIKGNLSLANPLPNPITRKRQDLDDRKPTIFIEFSPDAYLSLLPTLGSSSREWSQVE